MVILHVYFFIYGKNTNDGICNIYDVKNAHLKLGLQSLYRLSVKVLLLEEEV